MKNEDGMKTLIALTTQTFALVAEKILVQTPVRQTTPKTELTDEIRRYDTGDLILS